MSVIVYQVLLSKSQVQVEILLIYQDCANLLLMSQTVYRYCSENLFPTIRSLVSHVISILAVSSRVTSR